MRTTRGHESAEPMLIFVSWADQSRSRAIAASLGAEYVLPARWAQGRHLMLRYITQAVSSCVAVLRLRPRVVLFANPPCVAGVALLLAARVVGASVWCDCHSGAFNDPRWRRFARLNAAVLKRCDGVIFHNQPMADAYRGIAAQTLVVSGFERDTQALAARTQVVPDRCVVVPCSYQFDEPIDVVFDAAGQMPNIEWLLTGTAPASLSARAPANVTFTGWIADTEYDSLIARAGVVVCLTTREDTMQNGLVEAVAAGRPVITSATRALVDWCNEIDSTVTVTNESSALVTAAIEILDNQAAWTAKAA